LDAGRPVSLSGALCFCGKISNPERGWRNW
jgi:hypothetical protein